MNNVWRGLLACGICLGVLGVSAGCAVRGPGGYATVDFVDANGYHHHGYYDDQHAWHGGWDDENHAHHDDPPGWHQ